MPALLTGSAKRSSRAGATPRPCSSIRRLVSVCTGGSGTPAWAIASRTGVPRLIFWTSCWATVRASERKLAHEIGFHLVLDLRERRWGRRNDSSEREQCVALTRSDRLDRRIVFGRELEPLLEQ